MSYPNPIRFPPPNPDWTPSVYNDLRAIKWLSQKRARKLNRLAGARVIRLRTGNWRPLKIVLQS